MKKTPVGKMGREPGRLREPSDLDARRRTQKKEKGGKVECNYLRAQWLCSKAFEGPSGQSQLAGGPVFPWDRIPQHPNKIL